MEPHRLTGRALVTGASGFVGSHVARRLVERGLEVRCLLRRSGDPRTLQGLDVEVARGDLRDPAAVRAAATGCSSVFHCAADYRLYVPDPATMYACNVDGTRNVLAAAADAGAERVVYTSSVGALGLDPAGAAADESTPVSLADMVGHYKRSKFLAEREAERWLERGLPLVIVHPSTPIGEGDVKPTATGGMIVDFLRGRIPAYVDTGLNLIDVRDVASGHLLAAERGRVGEKYILGHRNLSLREILAMLAAVSGRRPPRIRMPHWVPFGFAALSTGWARLTGGVPAVPLDSVRLSRHKMFFDAGKAVRELGLPQTPVEQALARAVQWFRAHGYVAPPVGA